MTVLSKTALIWFFSLAAGAPAETIRILFRPSIPPFNVEEYQAIEKEYGRSPSQLEIVGHVAIELPPGSSPKGDVVGWGPLLQGLNPAQRLTTVADPSSPGALGAFQNDASWAEAGYGKTRLATMSLEFQVTPLELKTIVANLETLDRSALYHFSPTPEKNSFNCITILPKLFRGTSINLEIPDDGNIRDFVSRVNPSAQKWPSLCERAISGI